MKALVLHEANDLRFSESACASPGRNDVLVSMAAGGICGSDLHYFQHGGFGAIRVREPLVLGHEIAGFIKRVGEDVRGLRVGQLVAVSPSEPCGSCSMCSSGLLNHCEDMCFLGSAMRFPHIQGGFREQMVVPAKRCVPADGLTPGEAATAEPLSVCLHAASLAGDLNGKRVLVTGCGPIGMLMIMVAKHFGASEVIASDISDFTLTIAQQAGAESTINVAEQRLDEHGCASPNSVDVLIECSGAPGVIASALPLMRPRGIIVQVGFGGNVDLPMSSMTAKELQLFGSFRFTTEFASAVGMLRRGDIDVKPMITHTFAAEEAASAFAVASDRANAVKVQLAFNTVSRREESI